MPRRVPGKRSWTAWASTCAVECRMTARPSALAAATGSTSASASGAQARSLRSPVARSRTTTAPSGPLSGVPASLSACCAVVPAGTRIGADPRGWASGEGAVDTRTPEGSVDRPPEPSARPRLTREPCPARRSGPRRRPPVGSVLPASRRDAPRERVSPARAPRAEAGGPCRPPGGGRSPSRSRAGRGAPRRTWTGRPAGRPVRRPGTCSRRLLPGSRHVDGHGDLLPVRPGQPAGAGAHHTGDARLQAVAGRMLLLAEEDVPVIDDAVDPQHLHLAEPALAPAAVEHHVRPA